jgi:hypothetical protein
MSDRTSILTTGQKSQSNPEVGPRLVELLDRCGIAAAHFASRGTADLKGLLSQQPGRVASLTVLCPAVLDTCTLAQISERLLVVTGDRGPGARRVQAGLGGESHSRCSKEMRGGGLTERQCRNRDTSSGGTGAPRHSNQTREQRWQGQLQ